MTHATKARRRQVIVFEFDEELVLRTAAAIKDLLSDGVFHPWADCIDAAADFTDGRRRPGSDLAWRALTDLLDGQPTLWTGERGSRLIAMPSREHALQVACETCGSAVGEPCVRLAGKHRSKNLRTWPHEARQILAATPDLAAVSAT